MAQATGNDPVRTFVPIIFVLLIILVLAGHLSRAFIFDTIPPKTELVYRTVEGTGAYGRAEYYVFDTNGNRYRVSESTFDAYTELPRK